MKRWWVVMALMLSLGVNLGLLVSRFTASGPEAVPEEPPRRPGAAERAPPRDRPLPQVILRMADELGLLAEKREQFVALQRGFLRRSFTARSVIMRSQADLRGQLLASEPDRAVVARSLEQLTRARGEIEKAFVENVLETRELLDEEQTRRFLRMIARLRQSGERFQPRGRLPGERPWQRPPGRLPAQRRPAG